MFTFIETKLFSRLLGDYLTDEEYASLQDALMERPERGAVVPGSGGVRKLCAGDSPGGHVLRKIKEEIDG